MILKGIYQYLVKLGVFFNIPGIHVLCHKFIEQRPKGKIWETLKIYLDIDKH
jgi:hypothetical protein